MKPLTKEELKARLTDGFILEKYTGIGTCRVSYSVKDGDGEELRVNRASAESVIYKLNLIYVRVTMHYGYFKKI